jgi:hypothetical protein
MFHLLRSSFMRNIVLAAAALAALSFTSAPARADGAWCARDTKGGTNCGFHTFAQCQADISGLGGFCSPNPFFQSYNRAYQNSNARRRARDY